MEELPETVEWPRRGTLTFGRRPVGYSAPWGYVVPAGFVEGEGWRAGLNLGFELEAHGETPQEAIAACDREALALARQLAPAVFGVVDAAVDWAESPCPEGPRRHLLRLIRLLPNDTNKEEKD